MSEIKYEEFIQYVEEINSKIMKHTFKQLIILYILLYTETEYEKIINKLNSSFESIRKEGEKEKILYTDIKNTYDIILEDINEKKVIASIFYFYIFVKYNNINIDDVEQIIYLFNKIDYIDYNIKYIVQTFPDILCYVSDIIWGKRENMESLYEYNSKVLFYASDELKMDFSFIKKLCKKNINGLNYIPMYNFSMDEILELIKINNNVYKYIPDKLKVDNSFIKKLIKELPEMIIHYEDMIKANNDTIIELIIYEPKIFDYVSPDLKKNKAVLLNMITKNHNIYKIFEFVDIEDIKRDHIYMEKIYKINIKAFELREKYTVKYDLEYKQYFVRVVPKIITLFNNIDEIVECFVNDISKIKDHTLLYDEANLFNYLSIEQKTNDELLIKLYKKNPFIILHISHLSIKECLKLFVDINIKDNYILLVSKYIKKLALNEAVFIE